MLTAYEHASAKLNLIRSLTTGGFGGLDQIHAWNRDFVASSPIGRRYEALALEIDRALRFVHASRLGGPSDHADRADVWTSHEALLLPYEEALTRRDEKTGDWYDDVGAHALDRRAHAHTRRSPRRISVGRRESRRRASSDPTASPKDALELCDRLNPARIPGRLTLITRMGARQVGTMLPLLFAAVRDAGHPVVWACDPMHANTVETSTGRKTRHFDDVLEEVAAFFAACNVESVWPGGLHVELTGDDVTECLGGGENLYEQDLDLRYATMCDPRLNARQSLDLAFHVAEMLRTTN